MTFRPSVLALAIAISRPAFAGEAADPDAIRRALGAPPSAAAPAVPARDAAEPSADAALAPPKLDDAARTQLARRALKEIDDIASKTLSGFDPSDLARRIARDVGETKTAAPVEPQPEVPAPCPVAARPDAEPPAAAERKPQ